MAPPKQGGQGKLNKDGSSAHFTLWRTNDDDGSSERISWQQYEDGSQKNVHHTNQKDNSHSNDGRWRKP